MSNRFGDFGDGVATIFPVMLGVVPFGLILGAMAAGHGLSVLETTLMSALGYAGGAQFVAVDLWVAPLAVDAIIVTTVLINLRHVLMGAALGPKLGLFPTPARYLALFVMADENWAMAMGRARTAPLTPAFYFGMAAPFYSSWVIWTAVGWAAGGFVADPARFGLDFVFVAVFLTLLSGMWTGRRDAPVWIVAAFAALAAHWTIPGNWHTIIGGAAGMLAGAAIHRRDARTEAANA